MNGVAFLSICFVAWLHTQRKRPERHRRAVRKLHAVGPQSINTSRPILNRKMLFYDFITDAVAARPGPKQHTPNIQYLYRCNFWFRPFFCSFHSIWFRFVCVVLILTVTRSFQHISQFGSFCRLSTGLLRFRNSCARLYIFILTIVRLPFSADKTSAKESERERQPQMNNVMKTCQNQFSPKITEIWMNWWQGDTETQRQ